VPNRDESLLSHLSSASGLLGITNDSSVRNFLPVYSLFYLLLCLKTISVKKLDSDSEYSKVLAFFNLLLPYFFQSFSIPSINFWSAAISCMASAAKYFN